MNKRIFELAKQSKLRDALLLHHYGTIDALTDSEQEGLEQIENFAELIVKDCCEILLKWKSEPFPFDEDVAVSLLKEYFNIKK
jgi:hypothetical protein